jgi:hypothetical protein
VVNTDRVPIVVPNLAYCFVVIAGLAIILLSGLTAAPASANPGTVQGKHLSADPLTHPPAVNPVDQLLMMGHPLASPLLAQSSYPVLDEKPLGEDNRFAEKKAAIEPVTRKLPIWGEKAREQGFDLPLPFGVGANLVFMDQGIKLRNVKVGIGDPTFEVEGLEFSDARAHDRANTFRLDLWLLPFANIYGIFGYINGEAELDLDIGQVAGGIPGLPPILAPGRTIDLNIDYNGTTFGGGMTLAGGYKDFFVSLDGNYTYSNIDVADSQIKTYTLSPRLGLLVDSAVIPGNLALWVGGMYMRYKQTVTDDVNLKDFDSSLPSIILDFKLDVENEQPWNFLFGGQWEITKRWQFMAEGGVGDRNQVVTGLYFRF